MGEIIADHKKAEAIYPTKIQVETQLPNVRGEVLCRLFMSKGNFSFIQAKFIEPIAKVEGSWLWAGHTLLFLDRYENPQAVIAA